MWNPIRPLPTSQSESAKEGIPRKNRVRTICGYLRIVQIKVSQLVPDNPDYFKARKSFHWLVGRRWTEIVGKLWFEIRVARVFSASYCLTELTQSPQVDIISFRETVQEKVCVIDVTARKSNDVFHCLEHVDHSLVTRCCC